MVSVRYFSWLLGLVVALALSGCVTSNSGEPPLPEIATPDDDPDAPQFCNPQNKTGNELAACIAQNEALYKEFDEEAKRREPWFNFTPDNWTDSEQLDANKVMPVVKESDAVAKLAAAPAVELSAGDAKALTGKDPIAGLKPYLVRALFYYKESGEFSVFKKGSALLVQHDSIGSADSPKEQRTGLVVYLDAAPSPVYVDCSLAD